MFSIFYIRFRREIIFTSLLLVIGMLFFSFTRRQLASPSIPPQTLSPVLFYDAGVGSGVFGKPVIDSQGRILITSKAQNVPCGSSSLCEGVQLYSILPTGQENWQRLADSDPSPFGNDIGRIVLGPNDRIYIQGYQARLAAFDPSGNPISGWPVATGLTAFSNDKAVLVDAIDGTVYAKTLIFLSFRFYNPAKNIIALNPDGSQKWSIGFSEGPSSVGFAGLIQGPQNDLYSFMGNSFTRLDRNTGNQTCSIPSSGYSGSFVGGSNGLFGPAASTIFSYGGDCGSNSFYTSPQAAVDVLDVAQNIILATDHPTGQTIGNLFAVANDGSQFWRSQQIAVDRSASPIQVIKGNTVYVLGQDLNDNNSQKLFLVDLQSGQVLNSVLTSPACNSCGVAVSNDGTIYLSDLTSTKIYKISSGPPPPNRAPIAGFTITSGSTSAVEGQTLNITAPAGPVFVNLTSDRSSDPDGNVASWEWKIDGHTVSNSSGFTYGLTLGSHTVSLVVKDNQGASSESVSGQVVIAFPDSDGDGIPDDWETNGYYYNGRFVDLPAMGANPNHKDIFVQVDYMTGLRPKQAAIDMVRDSFSRVPNNLFEIPNPDGANGITLHVQIDNEVPRINHLGTNSNNNYNWGDFDAVKAANFDEALTLSHHYCLFAYDGPITNGSPNSGIARGSDFIVSLGSWPSEILLGQEIGEGGTTSDQAGTFMHELGHNLGLNHGGFESLPNNKPNYLSVMNYSFQLTGVLFDGSGIFDYSRFTLPDLNEAHLDERVGLNGGPALNGYGTSWQIGSATKWIRNANGPINWNGNKTLLLFDNIENDVPADINGDGFQSTLTSYNDWSHIDFKGGSIGLGAPVPLPVETTNNEINLEVARSLIPPEPSGLGARVEGCSVQVGWIPVGPQNDYSYRIYRSTGTSFYVLVSTVNTASFADVGLDLSKTYSYYVTTINSSHRESAPSQIVIVSDNTPPTVIAPAPTSAPSDTSCQAKIPNVLPQTAAFDNCGTVTLQQSPVAGTLVGIGPHTITITGKDAANNSAIATTNFTVLAGPSFDVSVTPSTVKRGGQVTLRVVFSNCANSKQSLTLKVSLTTPHVSNLMVSLPLMLQPGQRGTLNVPLTIPKPTAVGLYSLTLDVYVGGTRIGTSTAQVTITP